MVGLACSDAPTAPTGHAAEETLIVSAVGVADDAAGIVLRVAGPVLAIEPTRASLEVGWATDDAQGTTIVIIGALAGSTDLVLVTRRATAAPLDAQVIEISDANGALSEASSVHAIARPVGGD